LYAIHLNDNSLFCILTNLDVSFYIPKPSQQSGTLASLDEYYKVESVKPERLFVCPYCHEFRSTLEREYQRHIVLKHPGKSGYPNMSVEG